MSSPSQLPADAEQPDEDGHCANSDCLYCLRARAYDRWHATRKGE